MLLTLCSPCSPPSQTAGAHTVASIILHNPTDWDGPSVVEVPAGRIAAPGILNWRRVRLRMDGKTVPYAIREGRAHWKARLTAPLADVRPEDLLVFSVRVPPRGAVALEVCPGAPPARSAMTERDKRIAVAYPGIRVVVDRSTGMLTEFGAHGEPMLDGPLTVVPSLLAGAGYRMDGPVAVSYSTASVVIDRGAPGKFAAELVGRSSNPAMTELHFMLRSDDGLAMGLTYRVHASGVLDIALDERPWQGQSPWLRHAVECHLSLKGAVTGLPRLESRWPFYGFRDYTAAVKGIARIHAGTRAGVLELGDETVNGRSFTRRLIAFPTSSAQNPEVVAKLADEGLVVDVVPVRSPPISSDVRVIGTSGMADAAIRILSKACAEAAGERRTAPADRHTDLVRLVLGADSAANTLEGDGYTIAALPDGEVRVHSCTRLGLTNAANAIARHIRRRGLAGGLPLVARNPVVDIRGGGFGGGNHEVDFPYGSDDEWKGVFDGLLDSGMNVFTCMGMWSNWKMPVGFKYMPELRSNAPDAYDESSGAKFAELDAQREHGRVLASYLQDRGAQVWLWIPIGCVPTTFAKQHPEAMSPGSDKIPCFTHPEYRRYIDAFFRELLETYSLDGVFLIRDDNGGICSCDRCKAYVAQSRTKDPVWEQYMVIYDWLRTHHYSGAVAVYPYNDPYMPRLDALLPADLYVMGHGAGASVLSRDYEHLGPMGDTWIDNLYANFRLAPSTRMRRLLSARGGYWIGGAYRGTELPWESVGYFGWEPTATPSSLRYDWGLREFGEAGAMPFVQMSEAYEHLWDMNALEMLPVNWMRLTPGRRAEVVREGDDYAQRLRDAIVELKRVAGPASMARWFGHVDLFAPFFQYHLHRLDRFAAIHDRVLAHRSDLTSSAGLPAADRAAILDDYSTILSWAARYDAAMAKAPSGMLDNCRWMTKPYKEWMAGYDQWFDWTLALPQFAGSGHIACGPVSPGKPFTLRVELRNEGLCPWYAGAGHRLELAGDGQKLGLPAMVEFAGEPVAPGDRRIIEVRGTAPGSAGSYRVSAAFLSPFSVSPGKLAQCEATVLVR